MKDANQSANRIIFTVFGKPAQMGSKKAFFVKNLNRSVITDVNSKRKKEWTGSVAQAAAQVMKGRELLSGAIKLTVHFHFQRPGSHFGTGKNKSVLKSSAPRRHTQTPDLDKLIRCLGDALTGIVYRDDRQICEVQALRCWTTSQEQALICVDEYLEGN